MALVEIVRLKEIEQRAKEVRIQAAEALVEYGVGLTLRQDLRHVATVLTLGAVKAVPNLTYAGERLAGCLHWLLSGANIYFEAFDPAVRQRFSIGHELGHFFLHVHILRRANSVHADPQRDDEDEMLQIWEHEADAFAAAFLMPTESLQSDLAAFGPALPFLAERYGVSEKAMGRRLKTLKELSV